ncbi:hypothetical protein ACE6H2_010620 [Prunus campanulata]
MGPVRTITTLIVSSINIVVALYVLRSQYASLYIYCDRDSRPSTKCSVNILVKLLGTLRIRLGEWRNQFGFEKQLNPVELIRLVKAIKKELCREVVVELPQPLKLKITNEIVERLKTLRPKANVAEEREYQILPGRPPPPECHVQAETLKLNFKDKYPESYRNSHPSAPLLVPWASGIVGP